MYDIWNMWIDLKQSAEVEYNPFFYFFSFFLDLVVFCYIDFIYSNTSLCAYKNKNLLPDLKKTTKPLNLLQFFVIAIEE